MAERREVIPRSGAQHNGEKPVFRRSLDNVKPEHLGRKSAPPRFSGGSPRQQPIPIVAQRLQRQRPIQEPMPPTPYLSHLIASLRPSCAISFSRCSPRRRKTAGKPVAFRSAKKRVPAEAATRLHMRLRLHASDARSTPPKARLPCRRSSSWLSWPRRTSR